MNPSGKMNPRVARVQTMPDYLLAVEFDNGEIKEFDVKPYLDIGVFRQLRKLAYFSKASSSLGTVTWPDGQDFCPDTIYNNSRSSGIADTYPRTPNQKRRTPSSALDARHSTLV